MVKNRISKTIYGGTSLQVISWGQPSFSYTLIFVLHGKKMNKKIIILIIIISLIGGILFLPGPLERSSAVYASRRIGTRILK